MTYFEGFVVAVPEANKEEYRKHAADAAPAALLDLRPRRHADDADFAAVEGIGDSPLGVPGGEPACQQEWSGCGHDFPRTTPSALSPSPNEVAIRSTSSRLTRR